MCRPQPFPDHLASRRLRLRRLHPEDAEPLRAYRSLPEVARYQYWDSFGLDDAVRLIESQSTAQPNIPGTWFQLAIVSAPLAISSAIADSTAKSGTLVKWRSASPSLLRTKAIAMPMKRLSACFAMYSALWTLIEYLPPSMSSIVPRLLSVGA